MKTLIVLTFIGIVNCAYASFQTISQCQQPQRMNNFEPTKFFDGTSGKGRTWYVTHVKQVSSATVCQTFTTTQEGDKFIVDYGTDNKIHCEGQEKEDKSLTFDCKKGETSIFDASFVIMATDYDTYALFYRCITFKTPNSPANAGDKADNYLVLSSRSGNEEIPEQLRSLTSTLGLQGCSEIQSTIAA